MYLVAGEYLLEKGEYRKALQLLSACDPRPSERILQCCLRGGFADEYLSEVGMVMNDDDDDVDDCYGDGWSLTTTRFQRIHLIHSSIVLKRILVSNNAPFGP